MFRTVVWLTYFWVSLLFLVPSLVHVALLGCFGKVEQRDALVQKRVRGWMNSLLRLAGVTLDVRGLERIPKGTVVFAANHQGNFDIPAILCGLDHAYGIVAKAQIARMPFVRIWMQYLYCVFLDRDHPRKSAEALSKAADYLRAGHSMSVFPEGTRSRGRDIGEFKAGAFRIACKTGVPVVPVCIEGSYMAMEAHGMHIHPACVRIRVLDPVETAGLSREEQKLLGERVRSMLCAERLHILEELVKR